MIKGGDTAHLAELIDALLDAGADIERPGSSIDGVAPDPGRTRRYRLLWDLGP